MQNEYADYAAEDLIAALEQAGRTPAKPLLYAYLDRRDELAPLLRDVLAADLAEDRDWPEDDPRWYRAVHAGLLLIAFRDKQALPLFAEVLRDEENENFLEWFELALAHFGPAGIDTFVSIFRDPHVSWQGRAVATNVLSEIAQQHPAERDRIAETLRARLPLVDAAGRFVTPPPVDEDHVEIWTWVASSLLDLRDRASQPRVLVLYRAGLIDEMVMGDEADYLAAFDERPRPPEPFDLIRYYHPRRR
jgi:hypothetical protein